MTNSAETAGRIFRNRYFTKRNYECTNVLYCIADQKPETADDRWVETDGMVGTVQPLWIERGVRYFGWL